MLQVTELPASAHVLPVPVAVGQHQCPRDGAEVYAVGYPLINPVKNICDVVCTAGLVTVALSDGVPCMLHASTAAFPGSSGGGLFDAVSGCLLGISSNFFFIFLKI